MSRFPASEREFGRVVCLVLLILHLYMYVRHLYIYVLQPLHVKSRSIPLPLFWGLTGG